MADPAIFPFVFLRSGFREYLSFRTSIDEQGGGRRTAQKLHAAGELVVRGRLLFPNPGGVWGAFADFWADRYGAWGVFLYKRQDAGEASTQDSATVTASSQQDFAASRRYVDVATLVVRLDGVVKTLTTHYTIVNESGAAYVLGTSTKLQVRFVAPPTTGHVVTLAYEYYYPVRFEGDDLPDEQEMEAGGAGAAGVADRTIAVQLREAGAGYVYAETPNVL